MAQLLQTSTGYNLITSDKRLYIIIQTPQGWISSFKGVVSQGFKPSGKLVAKIPNHIKKLFFQLQKQS